VLQYATAAILGLAPGVNVMITIFSDFHPFYAQYGRFSWNPMLWFYTCCVHRYVISVKIENSFSKFFGQNISTLVPGPNPTIASYKGSVKKIYSAMSSLVRFENKNIFFDFEQTLQPTTALAL
jgi:hypothetical protein